MPIRTFAAPSLIAALALAVMAQAASAENFAARARIDQAVQKCRAAGGQPQQAPGLTRETRIGASPATVVDFSFLSCKGGPAPACGPFGCQVLVYLGARSEPAFDGQVKAWRVRGAELQVTRAGAYCSNSNTGACSESHRLSDGKLTLASRGALSFQRDAWRPARDVSPRVGRAGERGGVEKDDAPPEVDIEPQPRVVPPPSQNSEERRRQLQNAPFVR